MMDSIVLPTYRASFNVAAADVGMVGTPVTVTAPSRTGEGSSEATGVVAEIHDGYIVVEFIA